MLLNLVLALLGAGDLHGHAGHSDPPPTESTLHQEERSMQLHLHAAAVDAFPLFGPVREAEWAKGWEPQFIAPQPPAQGPEGAVFTTQAHGGDNVWVMTEFDATTHRVTYVIVQAELFACVLHIQVTDAGKGESTADVDYRYTALSDDGNDFIARWVEHWPQQAPHWEQALNERLATPAEGAKR